MKIKFDSDQAYQLEAMQAVKDLFDGQPKAEGQFELKIKETLICRLPSTRTSCLIPPSRSLSF